MPRKNKTTKRTSARSRGSAKSSPARRGRGSKPQSRKAHQQVLVAEYLSKKLTKMLKRHLAGIRELRKLARDLDIEIPRVTIKVR